MANSEHLDHVDYIKGSYMPFTASKLLQSGASAIHGVIINSHTTGTFRFYDALTGAAASAIGGTYTPAAGSSVIAFPKPIACTTGIFVAAGGTIDATVIAS